MLLGAIFGSLVGLVLGLTGAGGGMLAVPALVIGLGWSLPQAAPVSLLAVGLSASIGAVDGMRKGLVRWRAALLMATLGVAVSPLGVLVARALRPDVLVTLFAVAMMIAASRLLLQKPESASHSGSQMIDKNCMLDASTGRLRWTRRCATTLAGIGAASGLLTGMLGIAGGFVLVPAFKQWTDIRMHGIVATSLMVVALVSLGSAAAAAANGMHLDSVGLWFVGSAMAGMLLGRWLVPFMPARALQVSFALMSSCVALFLLARTWWPEIPGH